MLYSLCNKVLCYGVESAEKPRCRVFFFLCALTLLLIESASKSCDVLLLSAYCDILFSSLLTTNGIFMLGSRVKGFCFSTGLRDTPSNRVYASRVKVYGSNRFWAHFEKHPQKSVFSQYVFGFWIYHGKSRCHAVKTVLIIASFSLSILCAPDGWG